MDPLKGTAWSDASVVSGFARGRPNPVLMEWVAREARRQARLRVLDIGCGAGRNALPIAEGGHDIVGIDLSSAMLEAATGRSRQGSLAGRTWWVLSPSAALPLREASFDLVIAHGIWNLSKTDAEFRNAVREAARVARPHALLFVFTFSRHTLPDDDQPAAGQQLVFSQFSGKPQCFLSQDQLIAEMADAGFHQERGTVIQEYNRPEPVTLSSGAPVIYEGVFRKV